MHFLKKTVNAGWIFIREYSYLKIKFHLCISKIISKLLFMQEPTIIGHEDHLKTINLDEIEQARIMGSKQ